MKRSGRSRSPKSAAKSIATENLRKPALRTALAALLETQGLSNRALRRIHAHYLALYASPDPREQALGLKALHLAYRITGAYAPQRHEVDVAFHGWTTAELERFAESGEWPERLRQGGSDEQS